MTGEIVIHTAVFVTVVAGLVLGGGDRTPVAGWKLRLGGAYVAFGIALGVFLGYQLMWDTLSTRDRWLVAALVPLGYLAAGLVIVFRVETRYMDAILAAWITQSLLTNAWQWQFEEQTWEENADYLAIKSADSNEVTIVMWSLCLLTVTLLRATDYITELKGREHWLQDGPFTLGILVWVTAVNLYAWICEFPHPSTQILQLAGSAIVLLRWAYHTGWHMWRKRPKGKVLGRVNTNSIALGTKVKVFLAIGVAISGVALFAEQEILPAEDTVPILAAFGTGMLMWGLLVEAANVRDLENNKSERKELTTTAMQYEAPITIVGILLAAGICLGADQAGGGSTGLLVATVLNFAFDAFISNSYATIVATAFDNLALAYMLGHCSTDCASRFVRVFLPGGLYFVVCASVAWYNDEEHDVHPWLERLGPGAKIGIILYTVLFELAPEMTADKLWVSVVALVAAVGLAPLALVALVQWERAQEGPGSEAELDDDPVLGNTALTSARATYERLTLKL